MSDELKKVPRLWVGLINEILSEGIFIRVDHAPWKFCRWTTVLLLCRDATLRWNTLYLAMYSARRCVSLTTLDPTRSLTINVFPCLTNTWFALIMHRHPVLLPRHFEHSTDSLNAESDDFTCLAMSATLTCDNRSREKPSRAYPAVHSFHFDRRYGDAEMMHSHK
jgi:hypothetical protein